MSLLSFQDKLIFYPIDARNPQYARYQSHEFFIQSAGHKIQGWAFENPNVKNQKVLVYFGGNAEDVTYNFQDIERFGARKLYFFNYRGYGKSQGKPSQKALYEDGLSIYDYLTSQQGVLAKDILLLGRSLGSAVATYVAAERKVSKVILVTPFDSLKSLAGSLFPWLPVKWLIRHPFPSDFYAKNINTPLLMLVAEQDEVIPNRHSQALFDVWQGEKRWELLKGVGHNDIQLHSSYYSQIAGFVQP